MELSDAAKRTVLQNARLLPREEVDSMPPAYRFLLRAGSAGWPDNHWLSLSAATRKQLVSGLGVLHRKPKPDSAPAIVLGDDLRRAVEAAKARG